jgi:lauroyl/myristoyl acyltransferase
MQRGDEAGVRAPAQRPALPGVRDDDDLPLVNARDVFWVTYLFLFRGVARVSVRAARALVWLATPAYRRMALARKPEMRGLLAEVFGSELSAVELDAVCRRYASNFARRAADDLMLERGDKGLRCLTFTGREHLDEALAPGRGALLVGMHWYTGRAARRYLASLGYPLLSVAKGELRYSSAVSRLGNRFLLPAYKRFMHAVTRDEVYVEDHECSLKILRHLRAGGIICMNLDVRHTADRIDIPLFGRNVGFSAGALHIAHAAGCPVLPMVARGSARALEIKIDPPVPLDRALPTEEFCRTYLPAIVGVLEEHIRKCPAEWQPWAAVPGLP